MGSMSVSSCRCCMFVCILWQFAMLHDLQCINAGWGPNHIKEYTTEPVA